MFLKVKEKYHNVSLASMKADAGSAFDKSQLYFIVLMVTVAIPRPQKKHPLKVWIHGSTPLGPADRNTD